MPNIKSAIKRVRTTDDRRAQNLVYKGDMRTAVKRVETLVNNNDGESAKNALQTAKKKIDKAVQAGIIHQNNGNRQKSRLEKKVNSL
ncbi:30S ribosomal protein S20 [Thalassobacillus pellis]|uniref:30S ribosomal protein S20 n=1 Tax=Thalassobacillus pellis TaxID=748008 RepID=UPI001961B7C1|nr:30S ribosomal protein S20 [Thalassobacillus pellis]MBM7554706.1 small subunit ribosomal protein S20 [Thalassobacillus pellis]